MSVSTSPSVTSLSLTSPSMADSSETDTTSRSSLSPDNLAIITDVEVNNTNSENLPWILHRILECQLSCELPLRIMFAFNSGQKPPALKQAYRYWQYGHQGKLLVAFLSSQQNITPSLRDAPLRDLQSPPSGPPEMINPDHHPSDRFMDGGNEALLDIDFTGVEQGRRHSEGLPPDFVQNLCLSTIFPETYEGCDFTEALTGLDYIRDLEVTRRASLRQAAHRLGITKDDWRDVLAEDPDAKQWVENMQALELDVTFYYATIFVDLRIWTMINELHCRPFYKPNVLAMLNTLFPPSVKELPNDKIDKATLYKYRAHFYHYVLAVEKEGPEVLKPWIEGLLKPGTKHSWPETQKHLRLYFDRADNMIKASTAIHGIKFFRDRSSNHSATTPSMTDQLDTRDSGNTFNRQHSHKIQAPVPRSPVRTFESRKAMMENHQRMNIGTDADKKTYFELPESSWAPQETSHTSSNSPVKDLGSGTPNTSNVYGPASPLVKPDPLTILRSHTRAQSRPVTPLIEQGSEAAKHDSFTRPITPFEDQRQEIIARRETVTASHQTSLELGHTLSHPSEAGSYYQSQPPRRNSTIHSVTTPLHSDDFDFLKRPYEPPESRPLPPLPTNPTLEHDSSFTSLFIRQNPSAGPIAISQDYFNNNGQNTPYIEMAPSSPAKSTETFPRYSHDAPSEGLPLKKQFSHSDLDKSERKTTMHSFRSGTAPVMTGSGSGSGPAEIAENYDVKRRLQKQKSLPDIPSQEASESGSMRQKFVTTGDDYERITVIDVTINVPPAATSHGPTKKQKIHKAKSFASIRSWGTVSTTDTKKTVRSHKSSKFRCEPQEGEPIRGKIISEPFPMNLHDSPAHLTPESQSKEWTRRWFIEQAKAQRYGLNPPEGDPIKDFEEKTEGKKGGLASSLLRKEKEVLQDGGKEFEFPRATPKPPTRPNRQRWDTIFPKRPVEKKKPTNHTTIDVRKYAQSP